MKSKKPTKAVVPQLILIDKVEVKTEVKNFLSFPYADNSVKEVNVVGVLEFIEGKDRPKFMDEIYRVLVPEGKASFAVAYWNTSMGYQDYAYAWPPLCEQSFLYFNKGWREANGLKDRPVKCDFDFTYGYQVIPEVQNKNDETRSFHLRFYNNAVQNLQVVMVKRKSA